MSEILLNEMMANGLYDDPEDMIKLRSAKEVNNSISDSIALMSKNPKNVSKFGSWIYKSQLYPGDIDLLETESRCCKIETALPKFVKDTQAIVKKIDKKRGNYVGDIKAGIDARYLIKLGDLRFDNMGNAMITDYKYNVCKEQVNHLYSKKLITKTEHTKIMSNLKPNIYQKNYETIYDLLREKWLLRWSVREIIKGKKVLPGKVTITLGEAINMPTMTKIDMWTLLNGRYIEYSNVLSYFVRNNKGQRILLNYANDLSNLQEDMRVEIAKYAFSINSYKPYKMVKRMWSLARMTKDFDVIKKLTPLMQSDLGRLSQLSSDIEVLLLMLNGLNSPPLKTMMVEIDNFRYRLANVYEIKIDSDKLIRMINKILKIKKLNKKNRMVMMKTLSEMKKYISEHIKTQTIKALESYGLYPPPPNYLPKKIYDKKQDIYEDPNEVFENLQKRARSLDLENKIKFHDFIKDEYEHRYGEQYKKEGEFADWGEFYKYITPIKKKKTKKKKSVNDEFLDLYYKRMNERDLIGRGGCDNQYSPTCPNFRGDGLTSKLFQTAANIYRKLNCDSKSRPLMDGELHPKCWNFCGPGTRIDLKEVQDTEPVDEIDAICKTHDLDYLYAKDKPDKEKLIRKADVKMLNDLEKHKDKSGYSLAKTAISGKVSAENMLKGLLKNQFPEHYGSD